MAASAISTAVTKCTMPFGDALLKGIACNFLVCIAVWIAFCGKRCSGKDRRSVFPIMLFVLCGFEHSVANMYFISAGLFAKSNAAYLQAAADAGIDTSALTWGSFFGKNLLPVTIGNIIGGAICVGCVYWFVYVRKNKKNSKLKMREVEKSHRALVNRKQQGGDNMGVNAKRNKGKRIGFRKRDFLQWQRAGTLQKKISLRKADIV